MRDELQDTMMKHKRYDNIDGTGEMFMGLMMLGFALLSYLQTVLQQHSIWRTNMFSRLLFMYAVLIPALSLGHLIRRVIKRHITWPRTGYVAEHFTWSRIFTRNLQDVEAEAGIPTTRSAWCAVLALVFVIAIVAGGLAGLAMRNDTGLILARAAYLAFWVPIYAFWVFRMEREHRWKWLILLFMALGLVAIGIIVPGGFSELSRWVMLFVGLMWFISGGATLYSYLRRTHPSAPVME